ncbi:MAG: hypothetical protein JW932_07730 [Deltaproteobacteria bacterium]|nr:hypothetical protein [Deltaproteobacteria bacterium]
MEKGQKKIILIILLCIFAFSLAYRLTHPFKQERVESLTYQGNARSVTGKERPPKDVEAPLTGGYVRMDLLNNHLKYSREVQRNIFFSIPQSNVSPNGVEQRGALQPVKTEQTIPLEVARRLQVQQELNDFKSFGYLESDEGITLFLERGKQILVVRKGDRIDGKYVIKDITQDELTITAMTINEDVHIDISQLD